MKKIVFTMMISALFACNNSSETNEVADSAINDNSATENVNGNIPDTTNTITIDGGSSGSAPKDTSRK